MVIKKLLYLVFIIGAVMTHNAYSFIRIGHRGACGYEPENTLRSFAKAIEIGVDMIELDVYRCASGELVVFHDDTLERTTNGKGNVEDKTLEQLQHLNAGKGERIPTLAQVFDLVNKRVKINVELKGNNTAQLVAQLIQQYVQEKNWSYDDFIVSSFNHSELFLFKTYAPQVKISALFDTHDAIDVAALSGRCYGIGISEESVTQKLIDLAHQHNLKVCVYTVNNANQIRALKQMGVDGIFSDYPDRLQ